MHEEIYDGIAIVVTILVLYVLFQKKIRTSVIWRATVTPLASIIGSGFLVSAPLLLFTAGSWAMIIMVGIIFIAYGIGSSIRFNIQYFEPRMVGGDAPYWAHKIDIISRPALGIAYLISVTFYLKLLSAFALRAVSVNDSLWENTLTTTILLLIGITGKLKGLTVLESLETYSVNIKLAIILALISVFFIFNVELFVYQDWHLQTKATESLFTGFCKILGMLIIVQGFETSRYMGETYSQLMRISTMKYAQWLSGGIYIIFVGLVSVVFHDIKEVNETSIIDLSGVVSSYLPYMLIFAAILSQFSAAVSDTLGAGGLIVEATDRRITTKQCYLIISLICIGLTWLTNVYQIISIASKAFAFYYALQMLLSFVMLRKIDDKITYRNIKLTLYVFLLILMIMVLIFGIPIQ